MIAAMGIRGARLRSLDPYRVFHHRVHYVVVAIFSAVANASRLCPYINIKQAGMRPAAKPVHISATVVVTGDRGIVRGDTDLQDACTATGYLESVP